jgi:hypothetical protein
VARVALAYPDEKENERKWQQHLVEQKDQQNKATRIAELPANAVESMFFNYRLKVMTAFVPSGFSSRFFGFLTNLAWSAISEFYWHPSSPL